MKEREEGIWRDSKDLVSNPTSVFLAVRYWQTVSPGWWYSAPPTQNAVVQTSCWNSHRQIAFIKPTAKFMKCKEWSLNLRPFVFNGYNYYCNYYYKQSKGRIQWCLRRDWEYGIRFHEAILPPSALSFTLIVCTFSHRSFSTQCSDQVPRVLLVSDMDLHTPVFLKPKQIIQQHLSSKQQERTTPSFRKERVYTRNHTVYLKTPSFLGLAQKLALLHFGMANGSCQNILTNSIIWKMPSGTKVTPLLLHWQGKWRKMEPRGPSPMLGEGKETPRSLMI